MLEQANLQLSQKQVQQSEDSETTMAKMNEQVNKHVFLADMREKFFNELAQLMAKTLIKMRSHSSSLTKEISLYPDIMARKKTAEASSKVKQELHVKSVMFERDNL